MTRSEIKIREAQHAAKLECIFPRVRSGTIRSQAQLIGALKLLEREAHKLAEAVCNEPLPEGYAEKKEGEILGRLDELLGFRAARIPVLVNLDPRGYALKISDAHVRAHKLDIHTDWGGYGIICPDFS